MRRAVLFLLVLGSCRAGELESAFQDPPPDARPWVYWYWMYAAVSKEGIAADLKTMSQAGVEGAYLMPIKGPLQPPLLDPPVVQLSPAWWDCVRYAFQEADRRGLKLAMHVADGFAVAGGPWITPAQSMQWVTWSESQFEGGRRIDAILPQPPEREDYYRDIEVIAYPARDGAGGSSTVERPVVTASEPGPAPEFLALPARGSLIMYGQVTGPDQPVFTSERSCWIQYAFPAPFTCRAIAIPTVGNASYRANRFVLETSDDGVNFREAARIEAPRHGWEDWDASTTHAIPAVTARVFRFVFDLSGGELGAEDLDSAKWKPVLKLRGIELLSEGRIDGFEGKSGAVWRISPPATAAQAPSGCCVPLKDVIDLTGRVEADGRLAWDAPPGRWTVLRIGHTSSGHRNVTGGGGQGLECDKFDPAVARLQFDRWFGEAIRQAGPDLAGRVLKIFHIDSWECGSQNWSPVFREEFRRRRGYDPLPYLPAMAGIPVESPGVSERFLHDVRETIAELVVDNFYRPLAQLAHEHGCVFSAECVAPTFACDDLAHYDAVDLPMGEFWLRSPTHDKLNDVLDAVSGAHVYGKTIAQSEAFTELQLGWDETPAMLRVLADRNYAFGMNRLVGHVFVHNPWTDRKPGMTLDHVGTYLQRDQTWWPAGRAWIDYLARCQALLQRGRHVADVAVFTGEEIPRRSVVPWRLEATLPGMVREPAQRPPSGIRVPEDWLDPLHGYSYDSINPDALLRLATVRAGRIELPGGASYAVLVVPASDPMNPAADELTPEVAGRLRALAEAGATVILGERPSASPSLAGYPGCDDAVARAGAALWPAGGSAAAGRALGAGRVIDGPFSAGTFAGLGVEPDFSARNPDGSPAEKVAWTHRSGGGWDLYFISNQADSGRDLDLSLREAGRAPEIWDAVNGERAAVPAWRSAGGRTEVPLHLPASGSVFVIFQGAAASSPGIASAPAAHPPKDPEAFPLLRPPAGPKAAETLDGGGWTVTFDPSQGGPAAPVSFGSLMSWSDRPEPEIRHYSGTAHYERTFEWPSGRPAGERVWLDLGRVANVAIVEVNGTPCGIAWTPPYRVEVTGALHPGDNRLNISVSNTWFNRLVGDSALPQERRRTWTNAPYPAPDAPLLPAGLFGPVVLETAAAAVAQDGPRRGTARPIGVATSGALEQH